MREAISRHSSSFEKDDTMLERLVRMQHHRFPTRLLDITANPLNALYFCCADSDRQSDQIDGEVVVFQVQKEQVRYFDSDTVCILSNLALLKYKEKEQIALEIKQAVDEFENKFETMENGEYIIGAIDRLLQFVRTEKSYFRPRIIATDLDAFVFVKFKMNNSRIIAQNGAFIIFGLTKEMKEDNLVSNVMIERIRIPMNAKHRMLDELSRFGITKGALFPELDMSKDDIIRAL